MNDADELLDLVNEQDQVVGTVLRGKTSAPDFKGFLRAAEALIINAEDKLWIPRRQISKIIAPNGLDYSMGEHVMSGETYLAAALRGFKEELNLDLTEVDLVFLNKFKPLSPPNYFRTVFLYQSSRVPKYNPEDFSTWYWLSPEELAKKLRGGEPAKVSLIETVEYLMTHS